MSLFPIFLKLARCRCLVVGAGKVAESKIEGLLRAGADVIVVAPRAARPIVAWSRAGVIRLERRRFAPRDLDGVALVITATNAASVNARVFREARRRGILCNSVDDPLHCDFYYPAVVHRGPFQIAISTSGASPALAQRLRRELEGQFTTDYGEWVERLGKFRAKILTGRLSPVRRRRLLHRQASHSQFDQFLAQREQFTAGGKQ